MTTLVTFAKRGRKIKNMDIIAAINEGKNHIQQINEIRKVDKATNYTLYKDLKDKLFAFTPSCICEGETLKKENVTHINNIIAIDIDHDDNPTLSVEQMKEIVTQLPFVRYCSLSVGGKGIYCLIPFKKEFANKDNFKEVFNALQKDFKEIGIIIDKSCSNYNRARYVTYDDNEYWNDHCILYNKKTTIPTNNRPQISLITNKSKSMKMGELRPITQKDKDKLRMVFNDIIAHNINVTKNHTDTLALCNIFYNAFGYDGLRCVHILRKQRKGYDPIKLDNTFDYVANVDYPKCTIGLFFSMYNAAKNNNTLN
ncbi:BT4734/BF3469 family protein [Prevotella sp.]